MVGRVVGVDLRVTVRVHRAQEETDVSRDVLLHADPGAKLDVRLAHPAEVGRGRVHRAVVVEAGRVAGGGVLARIGRPGGDGIVEAAGVDVVAVAEQADGARPAEEPVIVLELDLIAIELPDSEIDRQRVGVLRRRDAANAQGPAIPVRASGGAAPGGSPARPRGSPRRRGS